MQSTKTNKLKKYRAFMDCYIVRVYRHIAGRNGQPDEIAGLVESVGRQDNGKPFTSYSGLVEAIRASFRCQIREGDRKDQDQTGGMPKVRRLKQTSTNNKS